MDTARTQRLLLGVLIASGITWLAARIGVYTLTVILTTTDIIQPSLVEGFASFTLVQRVALIARDVWELCLGLIIGLTALAFHRSLR